MTKLMIKAYRTGLSKIDLFTLQENDQAKFNAERLQRIWEKAVERNRTQGKGPPSLLSVIWRFGRTRFLLAMVALILSIAMQFLGPVRRQINRCTRNK